MEGLVKEYANFLNDDKKPASEKFWELEKRIKEDKRHPGVIMEMSKSEAIATKRKPAKVIDFTKYINTNRSTNHQRKRVVKAIVWA